MKRVEPKTFCCNRCGRTHVRSEQNLKDLDFTENLFHEFSVYFGYSSPFDDEKIDFMLCEICLLEFWRGCKHRPLTEDGDDIVEAYDHHRTNTDPYYKDYFIKTYNNLENLRKK